MGFFPVGTGIAAPLQEVSPMGKSRLAPAFLAFALLACAARAPMTPSLPAPPLPVGVGSVEGVTPLPAGGGSASAGGTAPGGVWRLAVRMKDGSVRHVDTTARDIQVGDRVELRGDGTLRRR
jgi:hypothetical protein